MVRTVRLVDADDACLRFCWRGRIPISNFLVGADRLEGTANHKWRVFDNP
jgi:hypothetical protein